MPRREYAEDPDEDPREPNHAELVQRYQPQEGPRGSYGYWSNGVPRVRRQNYRTNLEVDPDYYKKLFALLPKDPRKLKLHEHNAGVQALKEQRDGERGYSRRFQLRSDHIDLEFKNFLPGAFQDPEVITPADTVATHEIMSLVKLLVGCGQDRFDNNIGGQFVLTHKYQKVDANGDTRTPTIHIPFECTNEQKPLRFGFIWSEILTVFRQQYPHTGVDGMLLPAHVKRSNQNAFCEVITKFLLALLYSGVPVFGVLEFLQQQEYEGGAAQCHKKGDLDSHMIHSPPVVAILYFARALERQKEANRLGVPRAMVRTRPFVSTGNPMQALGESKKTRQLLWFLVNSADLAGKFEEDQDYSPEGHLRPRDRGNFFRQKEPLKLREWAQLLGRAIHVAAFHFGRPLGNLFDAAVYNTYDIMSMMLHDGYRSILVTGYLTFFQAELIIVGAQYCGKELEAEGFKIVHPRHPYHRVHVVTDDDGIDKQKYSSPVLDGFGEAYLGCWLSETICGGSRDDCLLHNLPLANVPRHVTRSQEAEIAREEREDLEATPSRLHHELFDPREENAIAFAARRRRNDPYDLMRL